MGCGKYPTQIEEYIISAKEASIHTGPENCLLCNTDPGTPHAENCPSTMTADDYVWLEEGTLNPVNGHFLDTQCYIAAGMPSSREGWVAP